MLTNDLSAVTVANQNTGVGITMVKIYKFIKINEVFPSLRFINL